MIRASIRRQVTERATNGDIDTYLDEWQLETDAAWSPDLVDDTRTRLHRMWAECRETEIGNLADELGEDS